MVWRQSPADSSFLVYVCAGERRELFCLSAADLFVCVCVGLRCWSYLVYNPPDFKGNKYCGGMISIIKSVLPHWRTCKRLL